MSLASDFAARYARPPSTTTVDSAVSIHTNVRAALGDSEYATFLQGSYKNDTALWDMNDVDIVALSRGVKSSVFTGTVPVNGGISWNELFARVERKLQAVEAYKGMYCPSVNRTLGLRS